MNVGQRRRNTVHQYWWRRVLRQAWCSPKCSYIMAAYTFPLAQSKMCQYGVWLLPLPRLTCNKQQNGSRISNHTKLWTSRTKCDERWFITPLRRASADASCAEIPTRAVSTSMRGRTWHIWTLSSPLHDVCSLPHQFRLPSTFNSRLGTG